MLDRLKVTGYAMALRMGQLDVVANNLANIDTTGFKRDALFMNELDKKMKELQFSKFAVKTHIPFAGSAVDLQQGALASTGQPLDVAISGDGFFTVETPAGEAYTRDGRFTLDTEGTLVNLDGYPVLGDGGPIQIDLQQNKPSEILINDHGEVLLDGDIIATLQIVSPTAPEDLVKLGANLFQLASGNAEVNPTTNASVRQGFLEESNVDAIQELVTMMDVFHFYETGQRMIREQDRVLNRAVNDIGRVG